jgi:predicted ATPase
LTTDEHLFEAEVQRVSGALLKAASDNPGQSGTIATPSSLPSGRARSSFQLRASASLGRLWRDQSKCAEARDLLGPIYNWFTEGFDAPDLQDAKGLLDELVTARAR